ncbi:MAG: flagellin [Defluviitaleaceae bacterium]|nr:flagellin [Defluviitaleaceae bacterium]
MILLNNLPSLRANSHLHRTNNNANTAMQRLSTGLRVNNAADDPATTAIANRFRREIAGLGVSSQNSLDGVSLVQTADGALNEVHAILERIRQLSVYGATGTVTDGDRIAFEQEIDQLLDEVESIARNTQFNGRHIFAGTFQQQAGVIGVDDVDMQGVSHGYVRVRVGTGKDNLLSMEIPRLSIFLLGQTAGYPFRDANGNPRQIVTTEIVRERATDAAGNYLYEDEFPYGPIWIEREEERLWYDEDGEPLFYPGSLADFFHSRHGVSIFGPSGITQPIATDRDNPYAAGRWLSQGLLLLDAAIDEVSEMRGRMGAYENRLTTTGSVLDGAGLNMTQALSRMVDTDMALEMTRLTQFNVIAQAGISVIAMSNQRPQQILNLLQF